jgi:hypothetical protein
MVDEPLNFDLTPEPEASTQPPVAGAGDRPPDGAADPPTIGGSDLPGAGASALPTARGGDLPGAGANSLPPVRASDLPAAGARAAGSSSGGGTARPLPPLPSIPESRATAYPFAMQPQFQAHAPRTRVSPRQRLLYGILAAIVSIMVVIGIVVALQAVDRAQRG